MARIKGGSVLMTEGPIAKQLISFSIPLMIGFLFQQLYTTVDSVVVGNVVGKEALAAVGATTPIVNMIILFFTGLTTGACVVIAKYFGAKDEENVRDSVQTSVLVFFVLSVVATAVGVLMVPFMLDFMKTPEDVYADAYTYLVIYFWGSSALIMYNLGSAILRAVGDSSRPLYFLIVSSVINVVFDILFVVYYDMGVAGAAYATVLSEVISALLVFISLCCSKGMYRLSFRRLSINYPLLKEMFVIGLPSGIQQSLTSFSNIFVQSYINFFGSTIMASWSSYIKIDQFVIIPVNSIVMAITTFVGQNLGAGEIKRTKKGVRIAMVLSLVSTAVLILLVCFLAPELVHMFNKDREVIENGSHLLRLLIPFYMAWAVTMTLGGALCGAGDTRMSTASKFFSFVIFRQIYLFLITQKYNTLTAVVMGYPAGWVLSALIIIIYYRKKNDEIISKFAGDCVNTE